MFEDTRTLREIIEANDVYEKRFLNVHSNKKYRSVPVEPIPVATTWTPSEMNTGLWLDGADLSTLTLEAGRVSLWNDKSGNNNHADQSSLPHRPYTSTDVGTGLNQLLWDGAPEICMNLLSYSYDWTANDFSVFAVASAAATFPAAFGGIIGDRFGAGLANWWTLGYSNGTMVVEGGPNLLFDPRGQGKQIYSINKIGALYEGFLNGVGSGGTGTPANIGGLTNSVKIGRWESPDQRWAGEIQEIIIVGGNVSVYTRQLIEGYLAHKWGFEANLDVSHPYKASKPLVPPIPPSNGTLHFEGALNGDGAGVNWPYGGVVYTANFFVRASIDNFGGYPGLINLAAFSGRDKVGHWTGNSGTITWAVGEEVSVQSMMLCPGNYNNVTYQIYGYNLLGVEQQRQDVFVEADDPKNIVLVGFDNIHSMILQEGNATLKVTHPSAVGGQMRFGITDIIYTPNV